LLPGGFPPNHSNALDATTEYRGRKRSVPTAAGLTKKLSKSVCEVPPEIPL
jgi:hypothetical protein